MIALFDENITITNKMLYGFIAYGTKTDITYFIKFFSYQSLPQRAKYIGRFKLDEKEIEHYGKSFSDIKIGDTVVFYDYFNYFVTEVLSNVNYEIHFKMITYVKNIEESSLYSLLKSEVLDFYKLDIKKAYVPNANLLCECYDIVYFENNLYFYIDIDNEKYILSDVVKFLSIINNLLIYISDRKYFIKIKLNSPGNICIYVENAIKFIMENWTGLLLLCSFLFGGDISYKDFTLKIPSLKNFINYVVMLKYNVENKKIENEILKEKYKNINRQNIINDIYEEQEKVIDLLKDLCEIKEKISISKKQQKLYDELIEKFTKKIDEIN